jgi:CRISPR-associated endonuclease Cas3-HD
MYYAHSPRNGIHAQPYAEHILGVRKRAREYARAVERYLASGGGAFDLASLLEASAEFHDLGKLERENQKVLSGSKKAKRLPKNHVDAGVAHFLPSKGAAGPAAMLIYAHHAGLPDCAKEQNRGTEALRDAFLMAETDRVLPELERIHRSLVPPEESPAFAIPPVERAVLLRILLSCLVDADHTNTGIHYRNYPAEETAPLLLPEERIDSLNRHLESLGGAGERNSLRSQMYLACRDAEITHNISACDGPVGSGKTFAVMAHLLKQA